MRPIDSTPKVWSRPDGLEIKWKPSNTAQEAHSELVDAVDAFVQGDYEAAIKVAERNREQEETSDWSSVKWRETPVTIPVEDLQDEKMVDVHRRQMLRVGKATHGILTEQHSAQRSNTYTVSVPEVLVQFEDGSKADLFAPEGDSELVEKVAELRTSKAGRKLAATQAVIAIEERLVHVPQQQNTKELISPSFAQFSMDEGKPERGNDLFDAYLGISRSFNNMEQEVVTSLYDAGMPIAIIEEHWAPNHEKAREPVMKWLKDQE